MVFALLCKQNWYLMKLANIIVVDCENFLHDIAICDSNFTTDDPFTFGGKTVEKCSYAEEDAEPSSLTTTMLTRTRRAGKHEWEY
jgi:hypothetical protein